MLSFISNIMNGIMQYKAARNQGGQQRMQAALYRQEGVAKQNAANSQAAAIDAAASANSRIANSNIRTMQEHKRAAVGSARVQQGASGLTSEGSGSQNVTDAQTYFDSAIADAALDSSLKSLNSFQTSYATRQQGEIAAMQSNLQAAMAEAEGAVANKQAKGILFGTILGGVTGAVTGYIGGSEAKASAKAYNAKYGLTEGMDGYINPNNAGLMAAGSAGSWGFGVANMLNPYTAGMTRNTNWGSNMSILMGNTPGIPDNRYSLAGFTGNK